MRLFVAIALPADLRARLAGLQQGLPAARWVDPDNLHLTLRFIGEADGDQAQDLDAALSRVRAARFAVTLAGSGRFGQGNGDEQAHGRDSGWFEPPAYRNNASTPV